MSGSKRKFAWAAALVGAAAIAAACGGGGDNDPTPTATPTATETPTVTPTLTPSPTPTATPDPLGPAPTNAAEAESGLATFLEGAPRECAAFVVSSWEAECEEADLDGDGAADFVYLVPLKGGNGVSPAPAAVFLSRAGGGDLEKFPGRDEADASPMDRELFELGDRNGDDVPELAYLVTRCGASNCVSRLEVQSWDGTAWRDIGPVQAGFDNPESIEWQGEGAESELLVRSGQLGSVGAGPTRTVTDTFSLVDGVYQLQSSEPEPPEYLFHAILDADAVFETGDFDGAIAAYEAALADDSLKDWRAESGRGAGLPSLAGYLLFRIAVATAATGDDPTAAIDRVINESEEPLFAEAVLAFRRGYQDGNSVTRGCLEATHYFSSPAASAILDDRFDYGYGNPRKTAADICPL